MATIQFNRDLAKFGDKVRDFEKSDEVGQVISDSIIPFYPFNRLVEGGKISTVWLGEGEAPGKDPDDLDIIIFVEDGSGTGDGFFDIILRRDDELPTYGGFAFGQTLDVTNEIVNAHRVLIAKTSFGDEVRYEYNVADGQYQAAFAADAAPAPMAVRKMQRRRSGGN